MAEKENSYRQVSLEGEIAATEKRGNIPPLEKPWLAQKAHFEMAGRLAIGLLILFALTVACSGIAITSFIITSATSDNVNDNFAAGIGQLIEFVKALLPYIATPLGVALGYFFKESSGE